MKAKLLPEEVKAVKQWLKDTMLDQKGAIDYCPFIRILHLRKFRSEAGVCDHPVCRSWFPLKGGIAMCPCYRHPVEYVMKCAERMVCDHASKTIER